jgi:hypothetical protein
VVGVCVARPSAERPLSFALDVMPPQQSALMTTEVGETPFAAEPVTVTLDRRLTLTTLLAPDALDAVMREHRLQVVLSVASAIAGRPERQFETTSVPQAVAGQFDVGIPIPERIVGREGVLRALPRPPLDRVLPPVQMNIVVMPVVPEMKIGGPADAIFVEGKLERSEPGRPETEYVARAVRGGMVVSNVSPTDKTGQFKLRIPRLPGRRDPLPGLSIELLPADPTRPLPRLTVKSVEATKLNLGVLRLPPFPEPAMFAVPIVSSAEHGREVRIPGAKVRFQTQIAGAAGADATFVREAQTDASGIAMVALLPGEVEKPRHYSVRVIPPEKSPHASRCVASYSVGAGVGGGGVRVAGSVALPPKLSIAGRVISAEDAPARGVRVRAMREGDLFVEACEADLTSPPVEATTSNDGSYTLLVDPGEYRLDYEPPMGSASPLHFEDDVVVRAPLVREVRLPGGMLVEARAVGPDGRPVADAVIKLLEPGRNGGRAILRGQGVAGADGRVRIVVPRRP